MASASFTPENFPNWRWAVLDADDEDTDTSESGPNCRETADWEYSVHMELEQVRQKLPQLQDRQKDGDKDRGSTNCSAESSGWPTPAQTGQTPASSDPFSTGSRSPSVGHGTGHLAPIVILSIPPASAEPFTGDAVAAGSPAGAGTAVVPSTSMNAKPRLRVVQGGSYESEVQLVMQDMGSRKLPCIEAFGTVFVPLPFCFQHSSMYNKYKYRLRAAFTDIPGLLLTGREARRLLQVLRCPRRISSCTRLDFSVPFVCWRSFLRYRSVLLAQSVGNVQQQRRVVDRTNPVAIQHAVPWYRAVDPENPPTPTPTPTPTPVTIESASVHQAGAPDAPADREAAADALMDLDGGAAAAPAEPLSPATGPV